jgi:hypothetical protein
MWWLSVPTPLSMKIFAAAELTVETESCFAGLISNGLHDTLQAVAVFDVLVEIVWHVLSNYLLFLGNEEL